MGGSDKEERPESDEQVPPLPEVPEPPKVEVRLPPKEARQTEDLEAGYRRMGIAYTIPIALVAPIVLLTLLGAWLDGRLRHSPAFTLGGALVGIVVGLLNMIRLVARLNRE
ncbi:MAG: AtpZ/AtpI family protein [Chthonomonadales bacterium]